MCKILECLGQHPRRNNLPKLTIFYPIFQLSFFGSGQDEMLESSRNEISEILSLGCMNWKKIDEILKFLLF